MWRRGDPLSTTHVTTHPCGSHVIPKQDYDNDARNAAMNGRTASASASKGHTASKSLSTVSVYTEDEVIYANAVIVAMPHHLAGRIRYDPPMPVRGVRPQALNSHGLHTPLFYTSSHLPPPSRLPVTS